MRARLLHVCAPCSSAENGIVTYPSPSRQQGDALPDGESVVALADRAEERGRSPDAYVRPSLLPLRVDCHRRVAPYSNGMWTCCAEEVIRSVEPMSGAVASLNLQPCLSSVSVRLTCHLLGSPTR